MAQVCRNGENCKFNAEGRCRFSHVTEINKVEKIPVVRALVSRHVKKEEREIGGFPVSMIKEMARETMDDEKYHGFVRACDGGAQKHVIAAMLYVADCKK